MSKNDQIKIDVMEYSVYKRPDLTRLEPVGVKTIIPKGVDKILLLPAICIESKTTATEIKTRYKNLVINRFCKEYGEEKREYLEKAIKVAISAGNSSYSASRIEV